MQGAPGRLVPEHHSQQGAFLWSWVSNLVCLLAHGSVLITVVNETHIIVSALGRIELGSGCCLGFRIEVAPARDELRLPTLSGNAADVVDSRAPFASSHSGKAGKNLTATGRADRNMTTLRSSNGPARVL